MISIPTRKGEGSTIKRLLHYENMNIVKNYNNPLGASAMTNVDQCVHRNLIFTTFLNVIFPITMIAT